MYIQVKNIKFIFNNKYENAPNGAEVGYTVVLTNDGATGRTLTISTESCIKVIDIPDDKITGKITILNTKDIDTTSFTLWDFGRYIHENITKSIIGG